MKKTVRSTAGLLAGCLAGWVQAQEVSPAKVYPAFAVGPSGVVVSIEKELVVTVQSVVEGSPAAATYLTAGDVLLAAEGRSLTVVDPRVVLGEAIGLAEADDGVLDLRVKRGESVRDVTVELAPLGAYRVTWPAKCPKSRAIIEATAGYVAAAQQDNGSYKFGAGKPVGNSLQGCLASLFLLSTGDERYLPNVARHATALAVLAENRRNAGGHVNWQLGYQGILLGEYYLRTGDKRVLAGLQELCNWSVENQAAGGWGHGESVGPGYVQSGLMGSRSAAATW